MNLQTQFSENTAKTKQSKNPKIELLSGPMDGLEFEITKDIINIGREQSRDIALPMDNLISRLHAKIIFSNGEYWLEDLGSRNGTYMERKKIKGKVRLYKGTIFILGATEMRIK